MNNSPNEIPPLLNPLTDEIWVKSPMGKAIGLLREEWINKMNTIDLQINNVPNNSPKCCKCNREAMAIDIAFPTLEGRKSSKTYFFCHSCFYDIHKKITSFLNEENYELKIQKTEKLTALNKELELQVQKKKEVKKKLKKHVRKIYDLLNDPPFMKLCEEAVETLDAFGFPYENE